MKKVFYFTIAISFLVACKKTSSETSKISSFNATVSSSKWELRKSEGSILGNMDYLPGNGITIEFYSNDSFKTANPMSSIIYRDSGTYTITNSNTTGDYNLTRTFINNGNPFTQKDSIRYVGTQLIFLAHNGWADEPTLYYEKQ